MKKDEGSEKQYRLQKHSSDKEEIMLKEEDHQYKLQLMQKHGVSLDNCLDRITEQKEKDKEEYEHSLEMWEKREKNEQ